MGPSDRREGDAIYTASNDNKLTRKISEAGLISRDVRFLLFFLLKMPYLLYLMRGLNLNMLGKQFLFFLFNSSVLNKSLLRLLLYGEFHTDVHKENGKLNSQR